MLKVLYVCGQECILDQSDGGKKCCNRNLTMLQKTYGEENVYAYLFSDVSSKKESHIHRVHKTSSFIKKAINTLLLRPFFSIFEEKKLFSYILLNKFDIVFFERSMFGPLCKRLKKSDIETQIFVHNIEKNYFKNKMKHQSIIYFFPYFTTRINEYVTFRYADKIYCLTERDKQLIFKEYNRYVTSIIPMTFDDKFDIIKMNEVDRKSKKYLLFIGSFFQPNYDGIKWFIENVMVHLPEITLYVVGKNFEKKKSELSRVNVKIIGSVDDLEKYYYSNCALVMPILYGDGMKVKTAEAMMYGKIIFASSEALEGYSYKDTADIYRCDTADNYVLHINNLFKENNFIGYSENVRNNFLERYDNSQIGKLYNVI